MILQLQPGNWRRSNDPINSYSIGGLLNQPFHAQHMVKNAVRWNDRNSHRRSARTRQTAQHTATSSYHRTSVHSAVSVRTVLWRISHFSCRQGRWHIDFATHSLGPFLVSVCTHRPQYVVVCALHFEHAYTLLQWRQARARSLVCVCVSSCAITKP